MASVLNMLVMVIIGCILLYAVKINQGPGSGV